MIEAIRLIAIGWGLLGGIRLTAARSCGAREGGDMMRAIRIF